MKPPASGFPTCVFVSVIHPSYLRLGWPVGPHGCGHQVLETVPGGCDIVLLEADQLEVVGFRFGGWIRQLLSCCGPPAVGVFPGGFDSLPQGVALLEDGGFPLVGWASDSVS